LVIDLFSLTCSVAFGIVSDSDIESEWLRWLGGLRFSLYVLYLLVIKRLYKLKITITTHEDEKIVLEDEFIYTLATNLPWITDDMRTSPFAKRDDGLIDFQVVRGRWSRLKMLLAFLNIDTARHIEHELLEYWKVKEIHYETKGKSRFAVDGEVLKQQNTKVVNIPKLLNVYS
jgi:sphingosine kinase